MKPRAPLLLLLGACLLPVPACVSSATHDRALADAQSTQELRVALLLRSISVTEHMARTRDAKLQNKLDEATAIHHKLAAELTRLGQNVDELLKEKGTLSSSLVQAKVRLEELRRAQAAAELRVALYRDVMLKLRKMIDAGELAVNVRDGRMLLQLSNDVLFDPGRAELKPKGKSALKEIAVVLKGIQGRHFQVAGHTDDDPIVYSGYASNWELSAARALSVVKLLIASDVPAESLSAAGYGQFDPVVSNHTGWGKQQNRRTEIVLLPNIDELVPLPIDEAPNP